MSDVFLFLDSEFTSFESSELISLALVRDEKNCVYVELNDYESAQCSEFVLEQVLPFLTEQNRYSRLEAAQKVYDYIQTQKEFGEVYIIGDYAGDWNLFLELMRPIGDKRKIGVAGFINLYDYLNYTLKRSMKTLEAQKVALKNIENIYDFHQKNWFLSHNKNEHHAKYDALANRFAFSQTIRYIIRHRLKSRVVVDSQDYMGTNSSENH